MSKLAELSFLALHPISLSCLAKAGHPVTPALSVFADAVPEAQSGGYWIARSSRAMTAMGIRWWRQDKKWTR